MLLYNIWNVEKIVFIASNNNIRITRETKVSTKFEEKPFELLSESYKLGGATVLLVWTKLIKVKVVDPDKAVKI